MSKTTPKFISLLAGVMIAIVGLTFGIGYLVTAQREGGGVTVNVYQGGTYVKEAAEVGEPAIAETPDMFAGLVHPSREDFTEGIDVDGTTFVDANRKVEASNLIQCKTWRVPEDLVAATSTAGGLNYEIPDNWKFITGGWFDVTNKNATTSFTARVGLASDEEASSSIAHDDDTASTTGNLLDAVIATSTVNKLFFFDLSNWTGKEGVNATSVDASDDYDRIVHYASTSYEGSWRGLCLGDDCEHTSSTPIWGDLTVCYLEEPTLE